MKKLAIAMLFAALGVAMTGCVSYEHIERDRSRHNREVENPPPPKPKSRPFMKRGEQHREAPERHDHRAPQPPPRANYR